MIKFCPSRRSAVYDIKLFGSHYNGTRRSVNTKHKTPRKYLQAYDVTKFLWIWIYAKDELDMESLILSTYINNNLSQSHLFACI